MAIDTSGPGQAPLNNVVESLRDLADRLERKMVHHDGSVLVVIPRDHHEPAVYGFGKIDGAFDPIIQFHLALDRQVRMAAAL